MDAGVREWAHLFSHQAYFHLSFYFLIEPTGSFPSNPCSPYERSLKLLWAGLSTSQLVTRGKCVWGMTSLQVCTSPYLLSTHSDGWWLLSHSKDTSEEALATPGGEVIIGPY